MNPNLKLDIFPHIFPQAFFERVKAIAGDSPSLAAQIKRWLHIPVLWDLEARLRMMERFPGYKQILTLSLRRLVGRREEYDRRKRQGEDLLVSRKALHHAQARFQDTSRSSPCRFR